MYKNIESEWEKLGKKAELLLSNPEQFSFSEIPKNFLLTFHLWIKPTFKVSTHWYFYEPLQHLNPQPKPRILKMYWLEEKDLENYTSGINPELLPSFSIETKEVDGKSLKLIIDKFKKIHLSIFEPEEFFGRDGDCFGVETFGFHCVKIQWHEQVSENWKPLNEVFLETEKILKNLFL